ncbi:MAG: hypothetical protein JWO53_5, partial [Chlamydiia bacterium]|nr:hypothetical protein [Chlamydiia bacterium]
FMIPGLPVMKHERYAMSNTVPGITVFSQENSQKKSPLS